MAPASAPLGGVDVFHLVHDREMRARGLAGNHCLFVAELEGRVDERALEARLARAVRVMPELSWGLARFPAWPPRWSVRAGRDSPAIRVRVIAHDRVLAEAERLLCLRLDADHLWALDVVRGPSHDAVVLRWFHPLVDARGGGRLLRWLGSGDADGPEPPPPPEERFATSDRLLAKYDRDARIALARAYTKHVMELGRTPTVSLAGASRVKNPGAPRAIRVLLSQDETRRFDARVKERAKLAETAIMLLATARVVDRALLARGAAPAQHLVPVPLSLDPKGAGTRMLGNYLTMMLLSLDRDDLGDEARAIAHLAEQQRTIVRQKLDVAMIAGLDLARWLPRLPYRWLLGRPFADEQSSLVLSNPGTLTVERFAGAIVRDAYTLPAVVCPPGFQVIFTRYGGRLTAMIVHLDGIVGTDEAGRMATELRAELLHGSPARCAPDAQV